MSTSRLPISCCLIGGMSRSGSRTGGGAEVADDLLVRLHAAGSFIYSPAKRSSKPTFAAQLGLSTERRLIVAYTSSLDEMLASQMVMNATDTTIPDRPQPFHDQIDWLTQLVPYVGESDDLQLVVRCIRGRGRTRANRLCRSIWRN